MKQLRESILDPDFKGDFHISGKDIKSPMAHKLLRLFRDAKCQRAGLYWSAEEYAAVWDVLQSGKRSTNPDKCKAFYVVTPDGPYKDTGILYYRNDLQSGWHVLIFYPPTTTPREICCAIYGDVDEQTKQYYSNRVLIFKDSTSYALPDDVTFICGAFEPKELHESILDDDFLGADITLKRLQKILPEYLSKAYERQLEELAKGHSLYPFCLTRKERADILKEIKTNGIEIVTDGKNHSPFEPNPYPAVCIVLSPDEFNIKYPSPKDKKYEHSIYISNTEIHWCEGDRWIYAAVWNSKEFMTGKWKVYVLSEGVAKVLQNLESQIHS